MEHNLNLPISLMDFIRSYPEDTFDMMTPGGYVFLTPEKAKGLLQGQTVSAHPGRPEFARTIEADELFVQEVVQASYSENKWHLLTGIVGREREIKHVDSAREALAKSLTEKAIVDLEYMSSLTGFTREKLLSDLQGAVFLNIGFAESQNKTYVTADEYLSGNLQDKLIQAKAAAAVLPELEVNVRALEASLARDLSSALPSSKEIRFMDRHNNEIFKINDGGYVCLQVDDVTDGTYTKGYYRCTYVDETTFKMDSLRFHNTYNSEYYGKESADNNATTFPVEQPPSINGYTIWETETVRGKTFMIGSKPLADEPFLVCQEHKGLRIPRVERYFREQSQAYANYNGRRKEEYARLNSRERSDRDR